jgi:hypothetical protein
LDARPRLFTTAAQELNSSRGSEMVLVKFRFLLEEVLALAEDQEKASKPKPSLPAALSSSEK